MHAQLEILLQVQDLKAQRRDLAEGMSERQVQQEAFALEADRAIVQLEEKIGELLDELEPKIRKRYDRLEVGVQRPVVPVIKGMCYGCFVSVSISVASDPQERAKLRNCDHCGRFLYFVD
jgi:predicted  nucleic acid-binding Zn-ribbon protein